MYYYKIQHLTFCISNDRRGQAHLYISFNKGNNEWTTAINMNSCGAKVNNTTAHHTNPSLSPDGKFLFFTRWVAPGNEDVMWVSASIIDRMKEKYSNEIKDSSRL